MSRDFTVQVSNRKVTDWRTGRVINDTTTKLTLLDGSCLVGFTGLGTLAGEPTHRWIMRALHRQVTNTSVERGVWECFGQELEDGVSCDRNATCFARTRESPEAHRCHGRRFRTRI